MSKEREITFALPVKDNAKALLDYSKKVGSENRFSFLWTRRVEVFSGSRRIVY